MGWARPGAGRYEGVDETSYATVFWEFTVNCDDIVCDLSGGACGGCEVMVWDRPGGGAAPKISENAASL